MRTDAQGVVGNCPIGPNNKNLDKLKKLDFIHLLKCHSTVYLLQSSNWFYNRSINVLWMGSIFAVGKTFVKLESLMAQLTVSFSSNFQQAQLFTDVLMLGGQLHFMAEWCKTIRIIFIPADHWRNTHACQFIKTKKKSIRLPKKDRESGENFYFFPATKGLVRLDCELRSVLQLSCALYRGGSSTSKPV